MHLQVPFVVNMAGLAVHKVGYLVRLEVPLVVHLVALVVHHPLLGRSSAERAAGERGRGDQHRRPHYDSQDGRDTAGKSILSSIVEAIRVLT